MIGAALYLSRRSLANATRRRLARLRQPKYLIGFALGILYYYWLIVRPRSGSTGGGTGLPGASGEVLAILGLATILVMNWLFGSSRSPFAFTPAETHYLFTAPLTRRQVLDFKLLRSQLPLFLSSLLSVLIFSGGHFTTSRIVRVLGLWLVFSALQMHYGVSALVRQSLEEHGVTAVRRRLGVIAVLAGVAVAVTLILRRQLPELEAAFAAGPAAGLDALGAVLHRGVLGVIVWPLAALVRPLLAPDFTTFAARLPAAFLVVGLHYIWLVRSSLAFEEVAVESAERMARRIAAWRSGRRPPPSERRPKGARRSLGHLAPVGSPARAIAWKNVQAEWRGSGVRAPVIIVLGVVAVAWVASLGEAAGTGIQLLAVLALVFAGMTVVFGPYVLRNDLRADLLLWDLLKSYPLRGADLVAGEVLGPVAVLTGVTWGCLLAAFAASLAIDLPRFPVPDRIAALLATAIAAPAFLVIVTVIQNAAALLFPAWVTLGPGRAAGVEMIGQRMLTMIGTLLLMLIAFLPAAIVAAVAVAIAGVAGVDGVWRAVPGAIGLSVTLGFEGMLAVAWLGRVFERSDPAAELVG